jgi:hypothetical protein
VARRLPLSETGAIVAPVDEVIQHIEEVDSIGN